MGNEQEKAPMTATEEARAKLDARRKDLSNIVKVASRDVTQLRAQIAFAKAEIVEIDRMLRPAIKRTRKAKVAT